MLSLLLDRFITAYLNCIMTYSDDIVQHWQHVPNVLEEIWKADMNMKAENCEFY